MFYECFPSNQPTVVSMLVPIGEEAEIEFAFSPPLLLYLHHFACVAASPPYPSTVSMYCTVLIRWLHSTVLYSTIGRMDCLPWRSSHNTALLILAKNEEGRRKDKDVGEMLVCYACHAASLPSLAI